MKKLFFFAMAVALTLTGCNEKKSTQSLESVAQVDSLKKIIEQRDNEINDMMGTLNEIQEGLREITEAENRVSIVKDGEGSNKAQQIKENVSFISNRMKQNRELIKKLQNQLRESSYKGDELKKTVENLIRQLDEKDQQLQQLRAELDAKDIHIAELDETVNNLNTSVSNLKSESAVKSQTINDQDKQLNTAWFVFGTKAELKEQKILKDGDVLKTGDFNKDYFTQIDIRVVKEIKLYSKSAQLLTTHPAGSYTLQKDQKGEYVLRITDANKFWSISKYLVIRVK